MTISQSYDHFLWYRVGWIERYVDAFIFMDNFHHDLARVIVRLGLQTFHNG